MSSANRKLESMRANPKGDWRIEDLESLAAHFGLKVRKPGGSHCVFSFPGHFGHLTVPARRPIKPKYVREFVALIDEIQE